MDSQSHQRTEGPLLQNELLTGCRKLQSPLQTPHVQGLHALL